VESKKIGVSTHGGLSSKIFYITYTLFSGIVDRVFIVNWNGQ
jgi:hypothetical protein